MQVTRDNHFVPKWYLKRWGDSDARTWCYRVLVPHAKWPAWQDTHVTGVAYRRDLYTQIQQGAEVDDFERWITSEYEAPAEPVVAKAVRGQNLTKDDWQRLVLFAASQDVRTPQHYIESMQRWREQLPDLMQTTLDDAKRRIEKYHDAGVPLPQAKDDGDPLAKAFKVTVRPNARPETKQGEVGVSVVVGRDLWLLEQQHILSRVAPRFASHSWCIAEAAKKTEWFTSDHPVVKLNWHDDGTFDVKGGWGKPGGIICMPLSRRHLLFTRVGEKLPSRCRLTVPQTQTIRRAVAARAWRMIFALRPTADVEKLRPRVIDPDTYRFEEEQWASFHSGQQVDAVEQGASDETM